MLSEQEILETKQLSYFGKKRQPCCKNPNCDKYLKPAQKKAIRSDSFFGPESLKESDKFWKKASSITAYIEQVFSILNLSKTQEKNFLTDSASGGKFVNQVKDQVNFGNFVRSHVDLAEDPEELNDIDEGFNCIPASAASSIAIVQRKKQKQFYQNPSKKDYEQAGVVKVEQDEEEETAVILNATPKVKQYSMQAIEDQKAYLLAQIRDS